LTSKMADAMTGYVHILEFSRRSPVQMKQAIDALAKTGATRYVIDLRGATRGDLRADTGRDTAEGAHGSSFDETVWDTTCLF